MYFDHIELSYVIPCYLNQDNQDSLHQLLRHYASYPAELMDRIQFVLVDDGSPLPVTIPQDIDLNVLLLRITQDIPWNQGGARNLGVLYSRSDKVIATDMDHLLPETTLRHVFNLGPMRKKMYKLSRKNANGEVITPHPNTFVMSRGRYLKYFGVDEEFSGAYGCEDGWFVRWQRYNGTRFFYMNKKFPIIVREMDDGSSHSLKRDTEHNTSIKQKKMAALRDHGPYGGHSRLFLNFQWTVVEDRQRQVIRWIPPANRWWKRLAWLRWLRCD